MNEPGTRTPRPSQKESQKEKKEKLQIMRKRNGVGHVLVVWSVWAWPIDDINGVNRRAFGGTTNELYSEHIYIYIQSTLNINEMVRPRVVIAKHTCGVSMKL